MRTPHLTLRLTFPRIFGAFFALVAIAPAARADIPVGPPPRPPWGEHPAPQPDPAPEKEALGAVMMLATLAAISVAAAHRGRRRLRAPS